MKIYMTPKTYIKAVNEGCPKMLQSLIDKGAQLVPTTEIYINMMGGWTEDQCDNTAYIVQDENETIDFNKTLELR